MGNNTFIIENAGNSYQTITVSRSTQTVEVYFNLLSEIIADSEDLVEFYNDEFSYDQLSNDEFQCEGDNGQEHEEVFSETHKFILVFWESLQGLFKFCFVCSNNAEIIAVVNKGRMVKVTIQCNNHIAIWNSQETIWYYVLALFYQV